MPNIEITNNAVSGVILWEPVFDDAIALDAASITYPAGTLLGRITASGKLTKYTTAASDGSETPVAIAHQEVELAAGVDLPTRVLVGGQVRRGKLLADDPARVITIAEADALRDYGITSLTTSQNSELDNQ